MGRNEPKEKKSDPRNGCSDENDEYFLYQTLIGAFPFEEEHHDAFVERIKEYMIKAIREAKVHTAWIKHDTAYEKRVASFIERILEKSDQNSFLKDFLPFQKKVAYYGLFNSLSQTLLKITSPGVPDFYRGTELWDLNLVDPDNRRPVDFTKRQSFLKEIQKQEKENISELLRDLLLSARDGKIKLFLIYRSLQARVERPDLFENGDYVPLKVEGKHKDRVVAFSRNKDAFSSITIVPRFLTSLIKEDELPLGEKIWEDTQIVVPHVDTKKWKNIITGQLIENKERIAISELLKDFPVTLLFNHT